MRQRFSADVLFGRYKFEAVRVREKEREVEREVSSHAEMCCSAGCSFRRSFKKTAGCPAGGPIWPPTLPALFRVLSYFGLHCLTPWKPDVKTAVVAFVTQV